MKPHPALGTKLAAALAVLSQPVPPRKIGSFTDAIDALAVCAVAGLTDALDSLPSRERRAAIAGGARAVLTARGAAARDESLTVAVALAEDGLAALRGDRKPRGARTTSQLHPSPAALVSMCRGEPDGLTAALVAAHVRRCDDCRAALEISRPSPQQRGASSLPSPQQRGVSSLPSPQQRGASFRSDRGGGHAPHVEPLRVAASTATVRSPADGRRVGRLTTPAVEAVLFDDGKTRRLAVYGDARASLRLVGDGLSTEEQLAGYWVGRVAAGVTTLRAVLHVGDAQVAWKLSLR